MKWEAVRLKLLTREPFQYGANEVADQADSDHPRYVRITDVTTEGALRSDTFRSLRPLVAAPYLLKDGDLLFARSGATVGKVFSYQKSWGVCCFAGYLIRFRADKRCALPRFVWWYTQSLLWADEVGQSRIQATIQNVSAERYGEFRCPVPPLPTQKAIADYLDVKTAAIDALIEKKRKLLDLLAEERAALINQAVTKGLDPAVPIKDSGIPWIGEVPAHWDIKRLKHISPQQTVGVVVNPSSYVDDAGDVPFIYGSEVSEGRIEIADARQITSESNQLLHKSQLRGGDLACVRVGDPGVTAVVPPELDGINCGSIMIVRRAPAFSSEWLCYAMNSKSGRQNIWLVAYGAAQKQYNIGHAVDFVYATPPLLEQQLIAKWLDETTADIETVIRKTTSQIDRLQEYRQALITAAVTGQLDIEAAA